MCKFVTIRCKICNAVIYNLPEEESSKLDFKDMICEDCMDYRTSDDTERKTQSIEY